MHSGGYNAVCAEWCGCGVRLVWYWRGDLFLVPALRISGAKYQISDAQFKNSRRDRASEPELTPKGAWKRCGISVVLAWGSFF